MATSVAVQRLAIATERALEAALKQLDSPRILELANVLPSLRQRWSMERLAALAGSAQASITPTRNGALVLDPRRGRIQLQRPIQEHLSAIQRDPDAGYLIAPLEQLPTQLQSALAGPRCLQDAPWFSGKLWVSAAGVVSGLHFDLAHNLHLQLVGSKTFLLAAPTAAPWLAPRGLLAGVPNGSPVDLEQALATDSQLLQRIDVLQAVLKPGDAVLLPAGWWHQVRTLESSVSVNYWWARGPHAMVVRSANWFKRARGVSV